LSRFREVLFESFDGERLTVDAVSCGQRPTKPASSLGIPTARDD
jgi:hypothetical protein